MIWIGHQTTYRRYNFKLTNICLKTLQFRKDELEPENIGNASVNAKLKRKPSQKLYNTSSFLHMNQLPGLQKMKMPLFVWGALPQISRNQPSIHINCISSIRIFLLAGLKSWEAQVASHPSHPTHLDPPLIFKNF